MPALNLVEKSRFIIRVRWLQSLLVFTALGLAAMHTWAAITSYSMNADGISYLDIGDAYFRGDWQAAINPVWSPMYSWILGLVIFIFNPSMRWEFPLVQLVNFALYVLALTCFGIFWKEVLRNRQVRLDKGELPGSAVLPEWGILTIGYLFFIWASLILIEIWSVSPDMLMAAIVLLLSTLVLRVRMGIQPWKTHAMFGLLLGVGYLTKTVMFPIAFLFLFGISLSGGEIKRILPRVLLSAVVFLLVSGPFIGLISYGKGRFTYGEAGKLTFIRHVNGIPYPHWQGEPSRYGTPIHPSRQIFDDPAIFEFASPIGGTYPITYDPSYWYEGAQASLTLSELIPVWLTNLQFSLNLFFKELGAFFAVIFSLYLVAFFHRQPLFLKVKNWNLALLSILVLILYSLIYVEGRYIGVFLLLLAADLLANLSLPDFKGYKQLITATSFVIIVSLLGSLVLFNLEGLSRLVAHPTRQVVSDPGFSRPSWPGEVAETLLGIGIEPGDRVGVIGYAFDSYWARLARFKIVAETFGWEADSFYLGSPEFQERVIQAFSHAGARAIVAEYVPAYAQLMDWQQVGRSNYYVYLIDR
jgi:hypothetical protein